MKHALPPLVHANSKILILGTMPGEKSIAMQQYYGNRGNQFWKILFRLFDWPFSTDYDERKKLLKDHHIALWNVLAGCEREGSSDSKIRNEVPNDFDAFHKAYPKISMVFFESQAALKFYEKYAYPQQGIIYQALPSTSGLYARMSFDEKTVAWQALKIASLEVF